MHEPWMHTAHGARTPAPHGWQQSAVAVQPAVKNGMHVGATHTPVASGLACSQTSPGAQTGAGGNTKPPQGPPTPDTQPQIPTAASGTPGRFSHVAPDGHVPPHAPAPSARHGATHSVAGPGQHADAPAGVRQMHACSQLPSTQRSAVQASPSSQSASVEHPGAHWQLGAPVRLLHALPAGQVPSHVGNESPHAGGVVGAHAQVSPVAVQSSFVAGQNPPHVPSAFMPQGTAHNAAGPGQQAEAPVGDTQTHACWQAPSTQ